MKNKELKIIGSYFPIASRSDFWYDLRSNKLKKLVKGKWVGVNDDYTILPEMPGDDEVWFFSPDWMDELYDPSAYFAPIVANVTIERITSEILYSPDGGMEIGIIYKLKLQEGDGEKLRISYCSVDENWEPLLFRIEKIYLPNNKTIIKNGDILFTAYDGGLYLSKATQKLYSYAIEFSESWTGLIISLSEYPPVIDSDSISVSYVGYDSITISVPSEYVTTYKTATNWSQYTIDTL